jgi:predicted metal-dependent HD superfamily phosphohydrolase
MSLLSAGMRAQLTGIYSGPGRHYHDLRHIETLLALAREHAHEITDSEAVEAAIWFHDAVYDTRKPDNEVQSADLAVRTLSAIGVSSERLEFIAAMIRASANHQVPRSMEALAAQDCALFLDMDLAILASPPEEFARYERGVRMEYDWVPERDWIAGRSQVLRRFLARPSIYTSPQFHRTHEAAARSNLARSLTSLTAGSDGGR